MNDDPTPSAKMNSEFQERMRRIFNHDEGDEDDEEEEEVSDMKDSSMDVPSISGASCIRTTCLQQAEVR